ncbi:hypothetical protein B566_EDAN009917 [Ephemera danica]|nr:hypothetical protein B566_EDAN009917 [Ephemera danica]
MYDGCYRPNVCRSRYRNYCCPGWTQKQTNGMCIVREYSSLAGDISSIQITRCCCGRCIKPNVCMCEGGTVATACTNGHHPRAPEASSLKGCLDEMSRSSMENVKVVVWEQLAAGPLRGLMVAMDIMEGATVEDTLGVLPMREGARHHV